MAEDRVETPSIVYRKLVGRKALFIYACAVLTGISALVAITVGSAAQVSLSDVFGVLTGSDLGWKNDVVFNIRLSRVIASILGGIGLAISGAAMQSILRNPLASPYTLGISSAAAFGAAFAVIFLGAGMQHSVSADAVIVTNPYIVTVCAFIWSIICTLAILGLSRIRGTSTETIVLAGIALGSLFSAGLASMQYFANDVELAAIIFWQFGDLGKAVWRDVFLLAFTIVPVFVVFLYLSWDMNALDAGDETAKSLGVNVVRVRNIGMCLSALATALVVSFFGIIGFVGLVVPHIVRRVIGGDERFVLPASAAFGGAFLLICDTFARTLISPTVLPVGIITSFMGAPLFIYLLIRGKEYW